MMTPDLNEDSNSNSTNNNNNNFMSKTNNSSPSSSSPSSIKNDLKRKINDSSVEEIAIKTIKRIQR